MHTTMAGLDVEVLQSQAGPPTGAVILCHGFGAPGDDLVGLYQPLLQLVPALRSVRFHFPAAPLELEGGFGEARAWWMIDFATLQRVQAGDADALREFRRQEPLGLDAARKALLKLVDQVCLSTGLPRGKVVLGGFSQGAMLACDVALRLEEAPAGLALLSGTLLTEDAWRTRAKSRAGLPVFQCHGRQDPLLSFEAATWLQELLTQAGLSVDFLPFDGGHSIPLEALERLATFLSGRFP